jgi:hypothetical protein
MSVIGTLCPTLGFGFLNVLGDFFRETIVLRLGFSGPEFHDNVWHGSLLRFY